MPERLLPILLSLLILQATPPQTAAPPTAPRVPGPPPLTHEVPPMPDIDPAHPTLFLVGDSTMKNGTAGQMGWGEVLGPFFDSTKINVVNYGRGGRSSRTYFTEGLWSRVLSAVRPGDFVLIQFGHNDVGEVFETTRPRASLAGVSDDTRLGMVALTHTFEVVHTFGWYLKQYIAGVRERGGTPILCSLTPRNVWTDDGHVARVDQAGWAAQVASVMQVAFCDVNAIVAKKYEAMGMEKVNGLFGGDHTHTNDAGARVNAAAVVEGLKAIESPLTRYLAAAP